MSKTPKTRPSKSASKRPTVGTALAVGCIVLCLSAVVVLFRPAGSRTRESPGAPLAEYAGTVSCRSCHPSEFNEWSQSHHRFAERLPNAALDGPAFKPPRRFHHGTQSTEVSEQAGNYEIASIGLSGKLETNTVERVIGHDPLRQFLVRAPGGRWQTLEASCDPNSNEWFDVFGNEDRQPGEWGHWTGRGMNWNSQCAACHNTRLLKNYDKSTDSYHTTMAERSVGCEACHGPMKAHVEWQQTHSGKTGADPTLKPLTKNQDFDTCGTCHSRRIELTGDFTPGDAFTADYQLVTVDETETYYPDGQVRDEDYEYAAFLGSKMYAAGVRCFDCHNPHTAKTILSGDLLCLRCHGGGMTNAPVIQPAQHAFHLLGKPGGRCVDCHMPMTVYMQRHARRDHGFTIPDPLLTEKAGIPNACNRCHMDKTAAWALAQCNQWYGEAKMDRPTRHRALTIAAARRLDPTAREPLLALLRTNEPPYWQAVAVQLLEPWLGETNVAQAIIAATTNPSALVRSEAARTLDELAEAGEPAATTALRSLLSDADRSVRIAAAWSLRAQADTNQLAFRDLAHQLAIAADQPAGQVRLGVWNLARGHPNQALSHYQKAAEWDPRSAPIRHELAIVLSQLGRNQEALKQMQEAVRLAPRNAEFHYKLALAWNEVGNLDQTIAELEEAVRLDPRHARAWYNLGLARAAQQQTEAALNALLRAEQVDPHDPRIPYARATVLVQLGRTEEARSAAQRALALQPGFTQARDLLESLR